jgi:hypothetical protein
MRDQLGEGFGREILLCHESRGILDHQADWLEVGDGIVFEIGIERRIGGVADMDHEQGVAVRRRARHLGAPDGAARSSDVLHDDLLLQRGRHALRDEAGDRVTGAACRVRHDHRHRPRRKVLGERGRRRQGKAGRNA